MHVDIEAKIVFNKGLTCSKLKYTLGSNPH